MLTTTKTIGKTTPTFDTQKYIDLFKELKIVPKVIETEAENEKCLAVVEALMFKGQNRTIEETALLRVLVLLIEEFEEKYYSFKDWQKTTPHEFLQHLMAGKGMKQSDLVGILSMSSGLISSIVNGKRQISKEQAKKLGVYFNVSPSLFI
jgi:HTH-type transcriptional regulator / antitoxin HigA